MKAYWDSSALVTALLSGRTVKGVTRTHSLAEVFSTFTGRGAGMMHDGKNVQVRLSPGDAAALISSLRPGLGFEELTPEEMFEAMDEAQSRGVRGGAVHDWLHAKAALKAGAPVIYTNNRADFESFGLKLVLKDPSAE